MDNNSFGIKLFYPFPDKIDIQFIEDSQPVNSNGNERLLIYRISEELEYTEETAMNIISHNIEKMAFLILHWLKYNNIQENINLVWRFEQLRYSLKIGCGAYVD